MGAGPHDTASHTKTLQWLALGVFCALVLHACPARGCRYNVREVGFIDVGIDPYRLLVYVPETVSADEAAKLKDAWDVATADTNIRCEPVRAGEDANLPVLPSGEGLLVSPDGQSRRLALGAGGPSLSEAAPAAVDAAIQSSTCRQILETAARTYGAVLLIEGPEADRNATAREVVLDAIARIGEQLEHLPKPIAQGPQMVVLDHASVAREETLLWSLGLTPEDINEPHAAVFYGRGRWLGPLFAGEVLTPANLVRVLAIIGADCECGLDHRWLQGTMLPARWDEALGQLVAENLGFDPESPMVKMEMVSIIRRGMGGLPASVAPLGYREIEVGGDAVEADADSGDDTIVSPISPIVPPPAMVESAPPAARMSLRIPAICLGGMIVLVGVASIVVVLRGRES
jgi:hypothetical protein